MAVALEGCERTEARVGIAELLRIKGDLILIQAGPEAVVAAEGLFWESARVGSPPRRAFVGAADRHQFRALTVGTGAPGEARRILAPVHDQFTEGFGTADMLSARQLLDPLAAFRTD